jgi:hypothetical protein
MPKRSLRVAFSTAAQILEAGAKRGSERLSSPPVSP